MQEAMNNACTKHKTTGVQSQTAWWVIMLMSFTWILLSCSGPQFPSIEVTPPPKLADVPTFEEPSIPQARSLAQVPPDIELVKSPDGPFLNGRHIALEVRVGEQAKSLYSKDGQKLVTGPFVAKKGVRLLPVIAFSGATAETHQQLKYNDAKYDVTVKGTIPELLPYVPVIDSDYWIQLKMNIEPYETVSIQEPEVFNTYEQIIAEYKTSIGEVLHLKGITPPAAQADFDSAKQRFILEGGKPGSPELSSASAKLSTEIAEWDAAAVKAQNLLEQIPNVDAYRNDWKERTIAQLAEYSHAELRFTVLDLSTHSIWGFGKIVAAGDSQEMALTKAIAALLSVLYSPDASTDNRKSHAVASSGDTPVVEEDVPESETPRERRHRLRAEKKAAKEAKKKEDRERRRLQRKNRE